MNAATSFPSPTQRHWTALFFAVLGSACGVCTFSWLFVRLIGSYWGFYDIGSSGPDGFVLAYLYAPGSLVVLSVVVLAVWLLCGWRGWGAWTALFLCSVAMLALVIGAFSCQVWFGADHSAEVQVGTGEFLRAFFRDLFTS